MALLVLCTSCSNPVLFSDGPFLGHVDAHSIHVYARAVAPGVVLATLTTAGGTTQQSAEAQEDSNLMVRFAFGGLSAATQYTLRLARDGHAPVLRTVRTPGEQQCDQRLGFASCAHDLRQPRQPIWQRLLEANIDALVLLGDTPYIDSTVLATQRERRRAFHRVPELAALLAAKPVWTTWDDHDFGRNDVDGQLAGKEHSRRALLEWSALASAGDGQEGIYTSFRRGPMEVFLLDARTFSNTADGPDGLPTLLGAAQWQWLREGLKRSNAPFKFIATGMVWNGAVRPLKTDMWTHWPHERDRLWSFLGQEGIEGVVLLSGDVHRTRVFAHSSTAQSGYPLHEFVTSPAANDVHAAAAQPHPDLLFDIGVPQAALIATVQRDAPAALKIHSIDAAGESLREDQLTTTQLVCGGGSALRSALVDDTLRIVQGDQLRVACAVAEGRITELRAAGGRSLLSAPWTFAEAQAGGTPALQREGGTPAEQGESNSVRWTEGLLRWRLAGPWTTLCVERHVSAITAPAEAALPPLALNLPEAIAESVPGGLCITGLVRGRRVGITVLASAEATTLALPRWDAGAVHFPAAPQVPALSSGFVVLRWYIVIHTRAPLAAELATLTGA